MKRYIYLIIVFLIVLCSCKTQYIVKEQEVPIERIKTEYVNSIKYDSIYIHDSINVYFKGDTIYKDKLKLVYKEKFIKDTVCVTDSVEKPIYITKEIPVNKITKTQQFLIYSGFFLYAFILLILGGLFIKLIYKK